MLVVAILPRNHRAYREAFAFDATNLAHETLPNRNRVGERERQQFLACGADEMRCRLSAHLALNHATPGMVRSNRQRKRV